MPASGWLWEPRAVTKRFRVAAVVLQRADGAICLVRKRGTYVFMNPGGKPESGESPVECAIREVREELDLVLAAGDLVYLGDATAPAANEPDHLVQAWVFWCTQPVPDHVQPAAEIDAVAWVSPGREATVALAPLLTKWILPELVRRQLWPG